VWGFPKSQQLRRHVEKAGLSQAGLRNYSRLRDGRPKYHPGIVIESRRSRRIKIAHRFIGGIVFANDSQ